MFYVVFSKNTEASFTIACSRIIYYKDFIKYNANMEKQYQKHLFLIMGLILLSSFQKPVDNLSLERTFLNDVNYYKNYITNKNSSLISVDNLKSNLFLLNFYDQMSEKGESIVVSYKNSVKKVIAIFNSQVKKNSLINLIGDQVTTNSTTQLSDNGFNHLEDKYTYFGVVYSNIVRNKSLYFSIPNVSSHLSTYSTTYMNETKITNVPNYKNTLFFGTGVTNPNGCTPTTAAMYYSYLEDNGYSNFTCGRNLPINYYDNVQSINEFIEFLGNNYFFTGINGSPWAKIRPGYKNYVHSRGHTDFNVSIEKNYNEFYNSVINCAMPVPVSISMTKSDAHNHDVLGIGIRNYITSTGTEKFIITNYGEISQTDEMAISVDNIRQFYFITK